MALRHNKPQNYPSPEDSEEDILIRLNFHKWSYCPKPNLKDTYCIYTLPQVVVYDESNLFWDLLVNMELLVIICKF